MKFKLVFVLFSLLFLESPTYAQIDQSLCTICLKAAQDELKKCLGEAISQEDKNSCAEKKDGGAKACQEGECQIERAAQRGNKSESEDLKTNK
jgi:hypothetical protein